MILTNIVNRKKIPTLKIWKARKLKAKVTMMNHKPKNLLTYPNNRVSGFQ